MKRALVTLVAATLVAAGTVATSTPAYADIEYRRGPDPTEASVTAEVEPSVTASVTVPASAVIGFGGGVIHEPTDTSQGTFGAVAFSPGCGGTTAN